LVITGGLNSTLLHHPKTLRECRSSTAAGGYLTIENCTGVRSMISVVILSVNRILCRMMSSLRISHCWHGNSNATPCSLVVLASRGILGTDELLRAIEAMGILRKVVGGDGLVADGAECHWRTGTAPDLVRTNASVSVVSRTSTYVMRLPNHAPCFVLAIAFASNRTQAQPRTVRRTISICGRVETSAHSHAGINLRRGWRD
jgi:hypothetical protein